MANTQAVCNSFKAELLGAVHDFDSGSGQVFKLALFQSNANLSAGTTVFTSTNEAATGGQYTKGGGVLQEKRWLTGNSCNQTSRRTRKSQISTCLAGASFVIHSTRGSSSSKISNELLRVN